MIDLNKFSESTRNYINILLSLDLYSHCKDILMLNEYNPEYIDSIINQLESSILDLRKDSVLRYPLLKDYIESMTNLIENDNNTVTYEEIQEATDECIDILSKLEDNHMVIETMLNSIDFMKKLQHKLEIDNEIKEYDNTNKVTSIIDKK